MKLVTAEQMRALEQRVVDAGTSLDELMQAAGLAVAQEAWLSLGVVAGRRILVLVGPGNNGGDGLVAARHLAEWEGDVVVYMLAARDESDSNLRAVRDLGVPVYVAGDDEGYRALDEAIGRAEMIIDALLGIGRSRPITGVMAEILGRVNDAHGRSPAPRVVAVDLPTGVDADSGRADPLAVRADMTVTFGFAKVGLYTLPGSEYAGKVQVIDIGLPKGAEHEVTVELLASTWIRDRLPARPLDANKGTFGRVLVVAGSDNYVGAARMTAEGCYRSGAGLVTIACDASVQAAVAPALPEATYLRRGAGAADALIEALSSYDVLLIGPGLGQSEETRALVLDVLARVPESVRGCVVDADALNALARVDGWSERVKARCVLTPHPGEMARLTGKTPGDVQSDRLNIAMHAASHWGQVVVLKGAHTIVANPSGAAAVSPYANPLLASAGTGDVLAGAIAGLLAQGASLFDAAACGVYVHAMAGEELGDELGDRGLLASDLLPVIPRVIKIIREGRPMRSAASPFGGGLEALAGLGGGAPPGMG
ncbi:MAG TPA: NAD(P)H-hydrate dehydratase [Dehalococcoidia bacterium]|nr:NAD(P)H-hydrate dehydratase [Dehalococcoidia bacterium]